MNATSTKRAWRRGLALVAAATVLGAGTAWLLRHGTRGAEIANILALPVAGLGLVVTVVALRLGAVPEHRTAARVPRRGRHRTAARNSNLAASHNADPEAPPSPHPRDAGRAMTKELFFLCGAPAPLHDAAAELRRAGYLVKRQPLDLDGVWSLQAYSAASDLSRDDLTTLDHIAERCGVEFDGWGTYVGPPQLDNGPGQARSTADRT